jgi:RNA polymerase sigma-70 factor (ECF subfamily)
MMWEFSSDSIAGISLEGGVSSEVTRRSRDEDRVIQLFDELRTPLLRYLLSFGILPSEGEELVQEVFLSLFRHVQQGKSAQNLRAWTFRVARNLALRRHRSKKRRPEGLFGLGLLPCQDPIDPRPNPEEIVMNGNRRERLMATFGCFPEQVQQTLHLRAEGLRYSEIAEVLGVSLTTVAGIVKRSLEKLQKVYES